MAFCLNVADWRSIIAVHGLNPRSKNDADHAWDTWRTPSGPAGRLWLRDDLPTYVPDSRIFLYQYNATAVYGKDRSTFIDKANDLLEDIRLEREDAESRPILFLGHSMGGLLIKQALINAHNNPNYKSIMDATSGLAFFATPHNGGDWKLVSLGSLAAKIATTTGFQKGDDVLETLKEGSIFSDIMHEHWRHQLLKYNIVSFWGGFDNVVPRESARLGMPGDRENVVRLDADHSTVCKFGAAESDQDNLKRVRSNIKDMYKKALKNSELNAIPTPVGSESSVDVGLQARLAALQGSVIESAVASFTLVPSTSEVTGVNRFVARGDELRRMHEVLKWNGERRTAVLHGLGGMGKTQLTIAYIKRHRADYSATIWMNARDEMSLKESFQRAAQRILREHQSVVYIKNAMANQDLDETVESVKSWLSEPRNDRWLVVYDNYDDVRFDGRDRTEKSVRRVTEESGSDPGKTQPEAAGSKAYDIRAYLPETDHGAIIITTRSVTVKIGKLIRLSKLGDINDSLEILASTSARDYFRQGKLLKIRGWIGLNDEIDPDAEMLARQLDGLPLALSTAGAYLSQVTTTCAEYLRLYRESWLRLQKESPQLLGYSQALYSTWGVSFRHIQQQSMGAAMLLQLWAYLDNEDLWYELLREAGSEGPAWLQDVTADELVFNTTMRILCEHGLVEPDPPIKEVGKDSRGYSVHGCVHAWMMHVLNTAVDEEMAWAAMNCVASHVPDEEQHEYWVVQRRLLQHADRCVEWVEDGVEPKEEEAWTYHCLGDLYSSQGRLKEAEAMYERALQGKEKALGPDHTSTLSTVNNLGILYKDQGRLKEAEAMYERALQGKEKALGPDHTSTLDTVNNLGSLYKDQGRLKEAEAMYERALQGSEKALGPDHTSTLSTVNNLGLLYSDQGRLKEAEAMYERALQGSEKALGPDHTSTLDTVNNLGSLYKDQGRLKEAEAMYERALQGSEKALGPDHTSTLSTVNNLGLLYSDQGRLKEAEAMYERALQGKEKALGPDHTSTLDTVNNLGNLYSDQGRLKEAEAMYERALQGKEKALGLDHTSTLDTVNNLGILYKDQGRLKEAEAMYERALQGKEKALGPDHTSTLSTVNNLGILYKDQGRLKEAEAMYERALQGKEKALGPDHTSTLDTVNNLGSLYKDQGRLKEAEAMYERALQGYEKALHPDTLRTYVPALKAVENIGRLFEQLGAVDRALEHYDRARTGIADVFGSESERYTHLSDQIHKLQLPRQESVPLPRVATDHSLRSKWKSWKERLKRA
ncbi:NB-ARC and TPR domain protein [Colletotrichum musicola]|uniref:NB-ARC and TPR domain protein n=1 Tax=Colletotrichum musicola TaxID=2175873 RepID=A0A8H6J1T3_9PEZI|nr:NB-ARC and TPR domain protein [Colletotrichum musicola]